MKGHKKRKRSFFTKGHEFYAARADRKKPETVLPQPSTSAATLGLETVNQGETSATRPGRRHGILGTKKIRKRLRRRPLKNTTLSTSGNRIINITKMVDMMNSLYKRHRIRNSIQTNCQRLNVAVVKEVKQGLAWQYQFRCKSCAFVSDMYRLYQVIPKRTQCKISQPRKFHTAAINLALSVVLMDTPIGNNAIRLILCTEAYASVVVYTLRFQSQMGHIYTKAVIAQMARDSTWGHAEVLYWVRNQDCHTVNPLGSVPCNRPIPGVLISNDPVLCAMLHRASPNHTLPVRMNITLAGYFSLHFGIKSLNFHFFPNLNLQN